jgi:hypothetical protein
MFLMIFAAALAFAPAQPATPAAPVAIDMPVHLLNIDTGKLKGDPWRLAWSPDGTQLYFEAANRDERGSVKSTKGVLITIADKSMKDVGQPPAWVAKYWLWKSGQASPAAPAFKIAIEQRQETVRSTAAPTGGTLAKGGTADPTAGTSVGDAAEAAYTGQVQTIIALKLKGDTRGPGETIGEWTNEAVSPGVNFGWAPAPRHLIAYAKRDGGPLTLLDDRGGPKLELAGTKNVVLPAFSDDGARLAWLEKKDRKHYDLIVAGVSAK